MNTAKKKFFPTDYVISKLEREKEGGGKWVVLYQINLSFFFTQTDKTF